MKNNSILITLESASKEIPRKELIELMAKYSIQTWKHDGDVCISTHALRFLKNCYEGNKENMPLARSKTLSKVDEILINKNERSEKLLISPDEARELLEHYHIKTNRNMSISWVLHLANIMKREEWGLSSLKFGTNNQLLDGQHRLQAVVTSGCSVYFFVQGGYPEDSMGHIDRGKARTIVDVAHINGYDWFDRDMSSAFTQLFNPLDVRKIGKMSDLQRIDCVIQLKEGLEFASSYNGGNGAKIRCASFRAVVTRAYYADKKIPKGLLNNAMAYVNGYNPLSSPEFFDENYSDYSPTILQRLREFYLAKEVTKYTHDTGRGAFAVKYFMVQYALNKFIKKEKISSLRLRFEDGNLFPSKLIDSMLDF